MILPKRLNAVSLTLVVILAFGLFPRRDNLGFGLPSIYDPDEPIFMITAFKLLKDHTFNPGWFGHPGSTTIYLLALIDVVTVALGVATGRFANVHDFAAAAYADPALLFLPSRFAMVLFGVGCILLTFLIGRALFGSRTGLVAAFLLAVNPLHIVWSQVIRTDVMASFFTLVSLLFAIRVAKAGRLRGYVWAGLFIGIAMATKWPSATGFIAIAGGTLAYLRSEPNDLRRQLCFLAAALAAIIVGLFISSPFIFIDWQTVLSNLGGEVKTGHLGHTSLGHLANLDYYVVQQIGGSMGLVGLGLAAFGMGLSSARHRVAAWILIPVTFVTLALICSQAVIWSRWVIPVLPFACLFAALAVTTIVALIGRRFPRADHWGAAMLLSFVAATPSLAGTWDGMKERRNDTRDQAATWAIAHIPPGSSLVVEHMALGLRQQPWHIKFPMGSAGCVDAVNLLKTNVRYEDVQKNRRQSQIVDLGNIAPDKAASCRSDFAMLVYYDLYLAEAAKYPIEIDTYRQILAGSRTVALFRPANGIASGPIVRILARPSNH